MEKRIKVYTVCMMFQVFVGSFLYATIPRAVRYESDPRFDFCDKGWTFSQNSKSKNNLNLPLNKKIDNSQSFTLSAQIKIPSFFSENDLYFIPGRINYACDIYANGIYIGSKNHHKPMFYAHFNQDSAILVPSSVIENGSVSFLLVCDSDFDAVSIKKFALCNTGYVEKILDKSIIWNMRIYLIMASLCLFLSIYSFTLYFGNKKNEFSLYYALSLIFISIYFFEMGSGINLPFGMIFRSLSRASLSVSMAFMLLFLMYFFEKKGRSIVKRIVLCFVPFVLFVYLLTAGKYSLQGTLFLVFLLFVFGVLIYGLYAVYKSVKKRQADSLPILIGFGIGVFLGIHDIVFQVMGKIPFAWLQGFAFFSLNISVFVAMSVRSSVLQKNVDIFSQQVTEQRDTLSRILTEAEQFSSETLKIANSLDASVSTFADSAVESVGDAHGIRESVTIQNDAISRTAKAVDGLVSSLKKVSGELDVFTESVSKTAGQTSGLIQSFSSVSEGVEGAASFSKMLADSTEQNEKRIESLTAVMANIRESSAEISNIATIVNDFAEKTNLLAMNASIEAAHSGAAGRGFSVIAHEIKKLAASSATQAGKIADMTSDIGKAIEKSFGLSLKVKDELFKMKTEAIENAQRIQNAAAGIVQQREAGVQIAEESDILAESSNRIREEASVQYEYSQRVQKNMNELASLSETVDGSAQKIVSANTELASRTDTLQELASKSRQVASNLDSLMGES